MAAARRERRERAAARISSKAASAEVKLTRLCGALHGRVNPTTSNDTKRPRGAFPPFRGFASGGVCETYDHAPGAYIERGVGQGGELAVLAGESPLAPEPSSPCPDRIAVLHRPGGRAAQVSVLGPAERGAMK